LVNCTGCGQRRCLLPVDGWFEWQQSGRRKLPYFLTLNNASPLSFAALWERWDHGDSPLETSTIDSRPSSTTAGSTTGSTQRPLYPRCPSWRGNPMTAPSRAAPSAPA